MRKAPPPLPASRLPLWGVLLAAGLLGCPKRIDFGPGGELRDPAQLLRLLAAAEARVTSVDAEGQLSFEAKEGRAALGALLVAAEPGRLQLLATDFFGRPQSQLVSDGQNFGLYLAEEGTYYRGPASPANLARFIRVPLSSPDLVGLLLGRAPRLEAPAWRLEVDPEAGAYRLTASDGRRRQTLWVDPLTFRALRTEVAGDLPYRARFGDLQSVGAVAFPRTIVLESLPETVRIELQYRRLEVNGEPDPALFAPEPPEGVRVIELDEGGDALSPTPG